MTVPREVSYALRSDFNYPMKLKLANMLIAHSRIHQLDFDVIPQKWQWWKKSNQFGITEIYEIPFRGAYNA